MKVHRDRPPELLLPFLEAARRGPSPEEIRDVVARLAPLSTRPRGGRIAAGCVAVAILGAGAWWSFSPDRHVVPSAAVAHRAPSVSVSERPVASAPTQSAVAAPPESARLADAPRRRATLRRRAPEARVEPSALLPAPVQTPPAAPSPQRTTASEMEDLSEIDLLQRAQEALRTEPARALALTLVHERRFPEGILAQEREVIAVDALSHLGRTDAARARADRFNTRWPGSAHKKRLDAVITR